MNQSQKSLLCAILHMIGDAELYLRNHSVIYFVDLERGEIYLIDSFIHKSFFEREDDKSESHYEFLKEACLNDLLYLQYNGIINIRYAFKGATDVIEIELTDEYLEE